MADIFISYARADRTRAERLAQALATAGWWDREIPPGRSFDEVIEEALSNARCVIVIWSEVSVRSEWVKTEAADAAQRRILVPILADGARIPLEFRRIQSAAFDRWDDPAANRDWPQLNAAVKTLIGARPAAAPAASPSSPPFPIQRTVNWSWTATAISGVLAAVAVTAGAVYFGAQVFTAPGAASVAPAVPAVSINAPSMRTPAIQKSSVQPPSTQAPSIAAPSPSRAETSARPPVTTTVDRPPDRAVSRPAPLAAISATTLPPAPATTTAVPTAVVPNEAPLPAASAVARLADRAPAIERPAAEAAFDVTLIYGVFRDQAGRLSISPEGVRFRESESGHGSFEVSCGEIRKISTATMIADREQRLLELTLTRQAYRLRAADTSARDSIRGALGRNCAR